MEGRSVERASFLSQAQVCFQSANSELWAFGVFICCQIPILSFLFWWLPIGSRQIFHYEAFSKKLKTHS